MRFILKNIILSVHYGHNATIALSIEGKIVCVLSEERLNRNKNSTGFPFKTLEYVVNKYLDGNINSIDKVILNDAELVGVRCLEYFGYEGSGRDYFYRTAKNNFMKNYEKPSLRKKIKNLFSKKSNLAPKDFFKHSNDELIEKISKTLGIDKEKIYLQDHHTAHILASMCFIDTKNKYLCFSLDGEGDSSSAKVAIFDNGKLNIISTNDISNSLGILYLNITGLLGMKPLEHEFKVMGMAPYAKQEQVTRLKTYFTDIFSLNINGEFSSKIDVREIFTLPG